jgi:hypothetical protein
MFDKSLFLADVKNVHTATSELFRIEEIPEAEVRNRLDESVDYDKNLFSKVLDDVCSNIVGNTMFRILIAKLPPGQKLKIADLGPEQAINPLIKQDGSSYDHNHYTVKINTNVYDSSGKGIPERQYYFVDEKGDITPGRKSIVASMFHEFTHCLHYVEDAKEYKRASKINSLDNGEMWGNDEECRTISGYVAANLNTEAKYDPICDNCFSLCNAVSNKAPYRQRISHEGYRSDASEEYEQGKRAELLQFYKSLNFNLAWPVKYLPQ